MYCQIVVMFIYTATPQSHLRLPWPHPRLVNDKRSIFTSLLLQRIYIIFTISSISITNPYFTTASEFIVSSLRLPCQEMGRGGGWTRKEGNWGVIGRYLSSHVLTETSSPYYLSVSKLNVTNNGKVNGITREEEYQVTHLIRPVAVWPHENRVCC